MAHPLEQTAFDEATFEDLSLEGEDLGGREFCRCTFRNVKLGQTRWKGARLEDCVFEGCDLVRMLPAQLALRDVSFKACRLMGVDFADVAQFPIATFEDCNLKYASFAKLPLRKTSFARCSLVEATFFEVDLTDARFEQCQLTGARFDGCDLRRARFEGAQGLFIDPGKNKLKDARVPLETAVLIAESFGLRVLDFSARSRSDDSE